MSSEVRHWDQVLLCNLVDKNQQIKKIIKQDNK